MATSDTQTNTQVKTSPTDFENFLVSHGFLQPAALETLARAKSKLPPAQAAGVDYQTIGELAIAQRLIDEEEVAKAKAAFLSLPYVDLRSQPISKEILDLIPEEA